LQARKTVQRISKMLAALPAAVALAAVLAAAGEPEGATGSPSVKAGAAEPSAAPAPAPPAAAEKPWSVAVETALLGKYICRGSNFFDDPILVPCLTVAWQGFTACAWGNLELTDLADNRGDFTEADLSLEYSRAFGPLALTAGATYTSYPHTKVDDTVELYASVGLEVPLSPTLTAYRDVDELRGTYLAFSLAHQFAGLWKPTEDLSVALELCGSLGWGNRPHNRAYYGVAEESLADATFGVKLPVSIGARWKLTPALWYSTLLDDDIRSANQKDDNLWGGLSIELSF
jgi:hypothetical protein